MTNTKPDKMIIIGGSAGSIELIMDILKDVPPGFQTPILLVIHRMKNTASKLDLMIGDRAEHIHVIEPDDKQPITNGCVYLAPQNYHVLAEADKTFSLDYSEAVNYSRPSIDVSFESFAQVFGKGLLAIVLSGANKDGAAGLEAVIRQGGQGIVQAPDQAEYDSMPSAAIERNVKAKICKTNEIVHCMLETQMNR